MARFRLYIGGLLVAVLLMILGVRTLFPDRNLRLEAELARMTPEAAFDRLEAVVAQGQPLGAYLAFRRAELAAIMGRDAQAADILDALATGEPPSAELADARAALALRMGQRQAAAGFLAQAQSLDPAADRRQRLGHLYRQLRDADAEIGLLSAMPVAGLTGFERMRLADLLAVSGEPAAQIAVLDAIIAANDAQGPDAAVRLTLILIGQGATEQLAVKAQSWLGLPAAAALVTALARTLTAVGVPAEHLARELAAAAPQARPLLVTAFVDGGQTAAARGVLIDWMERPRDLQTADWASLIHYSERTGDLGPLHRVLGAVEAGSAPGPALLPILRYQGAAGLMPYRKHLTPAVQDATPLIAAGWAALRQAPEQAYVALRRAAGTVTTPQDRALWRNIAASLAAQGIEARLAQDADPALRAMFTD